MFLTEVQLMPLRARRCLWSWWRSACVKSTKKLYSEETTYSNPLRPHQDIDAFVLPDWQPVTFHREQNYRDTDLSDITHKGEISKGQEVYVRWKKSDL